MALTTDECREMVAACANTGVALAVAYYRRWYPKARRIRELLDAGAIGTPVTARILIASKYDLIAYWLGEPESVSGATGHLQMAYGAPDVETLLCRMESGCHLTCATSWALGSSFDEMEVHGTEGSILASPFDGQRLTLLRGGEAEEIELPPLPPNVHLPLIAGQVVKAVLVAVDRVHAHPALVRHPPRLPPVSFGRAGAAHVPPPRNEVPAAPTANLQARWVTVQPMQQRRPVWSE